MRKQRRCVLALLLALWGGAIFASSADAAWYIWYRKCPADWKRLSYTFRTNTVAEYYKAAYKRAYPSFHFLVSSNYRNAPATTNPCNEDGRGITGNRLVYGIFYWTCNSSTKWKLEGTQDLQASGNLQLLQQRAQAKSTATKKFAVGKMWVGSDGGFSISGSRHQPPNGGRPPADCGTGSGNPGGGNSGGGNPGGGNTGGGQQSAKDNWQIHSRKYDRWYSANSLKGVDEGTAICRGIALAKQNSAYAFDRVKSSRGKVWGISYRCVVFYTINPVTRKRDVYIASEAPLPKEKHYAVVLDDNGNARANRWLRELVNHVKRVHGYAAKGRTYDYKIFNAYVDEYQDKGGYILRKPYNICGN